MISFQEALHVIYKYTSLKDSEEVSLDNVCGRIAADPVYSPISLPSFNNSAMDGFAFYTAHEYAQAGLELEVKGEQAAGDPIQNSLSDACEITTGAIVPPHFNTIAAIEQVEILSNEEGGIERTKRIRLKQTIPTGQHIRCIGEDVAKGEGVLSSGEIIQPSHVFLLAGLGISNVAVRRVPRIAVICTGRELVDGGTKLLKEGQIYNSNGPFLQQQIRLSGADLVSYQTVTDDSSLFSQALKNALCARPDIVISTGAVSMSRHDFVPSALSALNAEIFFHKVAIRPGKPILFARLADNILYFGLPGNPVSTAVGFRFFVEPAIRKMLHLPEEVPQRIPIGMAYQKKTAFRQFCKARLNLSENAQLRVQVLAGQASFQIQPMTQANCWAVFPENLSDFEQASLIDVVPLGHLQSWKWD